MSITVHAFKESPVVRKDGYYSTSMQRWIRSDAGSRPYDESRVFVDFEGETVFDNLNNRVARPYTQLRPIVIEKLKAEGIEFTKIRWSRKAGCRMCPCSPGFIIEGHYGKDFWLTVTDDEEYPARPGL
jgi:hypothetical protein